MLRASGLKAHTVTVCRLQGYNQVQHNAYLILFCMFMYADTKVINNIFLLALGAIHHKIVNMFLYKQNRHHILPSHGPTPHDRHGHTHMFWV